MAAAPKAATPASMPPPLSAPPPVPVSGITPQLRQKAPELTETPKGASPEKAFAERQRAAIAKATGESQKAQDEAAGEDAAPPPKAPATSATPGKSSDSKKPTAGSGDGTSEKPKGAEKVAESKSAGSDTPAEPSYDLQSLKKWAEREPEAAAAILGKLGHLPADPNGEWIKLQNKRRKVREEINSEREKTMADAKAERAAAEEARQAMDGAAGKLAPIADLWEAVREKVAADPGNPQLDFEAADAAFLENSGIAIDDYMRLRARRAIGSGSDAVKLRVENAKLKRELAKPAEERKTKAADSPAEKDEAGTAEPAAKAHKSAKDWSDELPGKHKLRQLDGWNALLDTEMRKHYDPDTKDYDADPEAIADKLLKREVARMLEEEPDEDAPKAKPKAKPASKPKDSVPSASELTPRKRATPKPAEDDDGGDDDVKVAGMTWAQRQSRALSRAMARARGEIE